MPWPETVILVRWSPTTGWPLSIRSSFYTHGHMYGVKYDLDTLADAAAARGAQVALFGHTHIPLAETRGRVFLFNPGSCGRCYTGADPYGILTLADGKVVGQEHKEVPKA